MNKKKAYKLADALESGKYKQARHLLRDDDSFCCLGVACDLAGAEWKRGEFSSQSVDGSYTCIPQTFFEKTGFGDYYGSFKKEIIVRRKDGSTEDFNSLMRMNDAGLSFKFIAKILRKHYKNIR